MRRGLLLFGLLGGLTLVSWLAWDAWVARTELPDLRPSISPVVLDRNGELLRPFTVSGGLWRLPVALDEVDPDYLRLLQHIEDRRFQAHPGVDPLALVRAAWQWVRHGRIVSGGSTLTMQVARLLERRSTRSLGGKLRQIRVALALERRWSKQDILGAYLTLAPYGGNLEGIRAASLAWLGREPARLSAAEAALLVALPQAPEARRPDRDAGRARRARDRILRRAHAAGLIDDLALSGALAEAVPSRRRAFPMLAAHLTRRQHAEHPQAATLRLTIDAGLQLRLEALVAEHVARLGPKLSAALLVVRHADGEVLVSIGSADPLDQGRQGFVDMTQAQRSPGSTLKPLIYGLAFEDGIAHPESLIEDRPTGFGGYAPANFDQEHQGTVTVRRALQRSLNVPAVKLLEAVGPNRLLARLRRAGAEPRLPQGAAPGLAIGLGGVGMTLTDLVRVYAAIARRGRATGLRELRSVDALAALAPSAVRPAGGQVLDARAAWALGDILAEVPTPSYARARGIAFKTGTSYGYRDAWAMGFDGRHTVGVWLGRPDGASVSGLVGIEAAAPLLLEAFARLGTVAPLRSAPPGVLLADRNEELPAHLRYAGQAPGRVSSQPGAEGPEIAYPPPGARVDLGLASGRVRDLVVKARGGVPPYTWLANGVPFGRTPFGRSARWRPDGPGYVVLSVIDGRGAAAQATAVVE
ncbi:penicillin-binding protein 1C [Thiorhodococcus minor]|uniref:peptidoglycan glycosyltransferase n=1 Tax=Thiorhodococcus minor TaxID=57489 RepID=A0A6M0JXS0_9GAMM|nr:penicillin-binding protein 1C [Thiorhodococcus minor]NEV61949.1 penicillin-binding protein 1C [Thiorhodococcus minor]